MKIKAKFVLLSIVVVASIVGVSLALTKGNDTLPEAEVPDHLMHRACVQMGEAGKLAKMDALLGLPSQNKSKTSQPTYAIEEWAIQYGRERAVSESDALMKATAVCYKYARRAAYLSDHGSALKLSDIDD